jgi:hypothetical protein
MYYTSSYDSGTKEVTFKLYKSPLKTPKVASGRGLDPVARLYGLEYIPAPLEDLTTTTTANQFKSRNLGSTCCAEVEAFRDKFDNAAYTNNYGSQSFAANWNETNDGTDSATAGHMQIVSNQLHLGDNYGTGGGNDTNQSSIYRQLDLSAYQQARLTFNFATENVDAGRTAIVEISSNNGSTYTQLDSFVGPASGFKTYDISGYIASQVRVRFRIVDYTTSNPRDYLNVDNFQVIGSRIGNLPVNTARWIITIPDAKIVDNKMLTVETRLGDQTTSGVMYPTANVPPNLSRTYVWRGDDTWVFGDGTLTNRPNLPITEQFQFLGDPRHLPYADLKRPHLGSGFGANYENRLGMGYNRYFDDFETDSSGNLTTVSLTARDTQNYTFNSLTNTFAVLVNETASATVDLPTGTAQSAANVRDTLNANAGFSAIAVADVTSSKLRIRAKAPGSSIQYDNALGENGAIFGFEGSTIWNANTGVPWPGWRYDSGGTSYGIKNDGTADNDTWHNMEIDVTRAFQMVRSGLINSNALWTTMTGFSYYYMGIGNEIGYDEANNFKYSIPISKKPYTGSTGADWEQTIIDNNGKSCALGCGVKYIRQQSTESGWWSLSWLGELYPDSQYAADSNWKANGNLRTGVGATYYVRDKRDDMPAFIGTDLERAERRTGPRGCTTLFWGETKDSAFHHVGADGDAKILTDGVDIRDHYELPVPDEIPNNRPWQVNWPEADNPENFLQSAYGAPTKVQMKQRYFERKKTGSEPTEASALVAMTETVKGRPAFIVVNGLSPTGITGTTFIAKWSFLTLIQSFLNGGKYNDTEAYDDPDGGGPLPKPTPGTTYHIPQLPRILITEPNQNTPLKDPGKVKVAWSEKWTRWDGQRYSNAYTAGCQDAVNGCYSPAFDRKYIVLYSPSNGTPDPDDDNPTGWFYTDGTPAKLGARDLSHAITTLSYDLDTPKAKFPEGNYLLRVEAYRIGYEQHYSFHQYRAYIQR